MPSMPVSVSQGDSPREKNMGKVCTGPQGNGLHPVCQSVQVRETVQEKRTWEKYVRLSWQWTTPSMLVSSSQGDSPREKNMGKVCTGPPGDRLLPVCQSVQVRETVQEKRTWER